MERMAKLAEAGHGRVRGVGGGGGGVVIPPAFMLTQQYRMHSDIAQVVCCTVLHCVALCCNTVCTAISHSKCVAVCCSVL